MIRVSIVEDDRATREGYVKLLRHAPDIVCIGAYAGAKEAMREIPNLLPDVVLMDINLGRDSGIDCVAKLKQQSGRSLGDCIVVVVDLMNMQTAQRVADCVAKLKQSHPQLEILMLTTYDDSELIFDSLRVGASGYLLKRAPAEEIIAAITDVREGGSPMSMQIARRVVSHFREARQPAGEMEQLTKRENEILALLAKGLPYKQIAEQLSISASTVHGHLHAIYAKLHVQSRTEAVVKYLGR